MEGALPMKRILNLFAILLVSLIAVPMFADNRGSIVDDVIRMTRSGVPEESIIDFVHKTDGRFDVSADDMIAMTDAKVSRFVMKAVLDEADARDGRETPRDVRDRSTTRVVVSPRVVVGSPYYYDPFYYGYDPFWYGPRFGFGISFGHYWGGGHHFGGGHWGGGGHHGGGHGRH